MLELSLELLKVYAQGGLSGAAVQRLAAAAWSDGWGRGDPLAERLARAGAGGEHSGNIQRDVLKAAQLAGITENTPDVYKFQVPGKRRHRSRR